MGTNEPECDRYKRIMEISGCLPICKTSLN